MNKLKSIYFLLLWGLITPIFSQIGGKYTYPFLKLPNVSRTAALGGRYITVKDNMPGLANQNPALVNSSMHKNLALSYNNQIADINFGSLAYAHTLKKHTYTLNMVYMNYGHFDRYNEKGEPFGTFTADDYVFNLSTSRKINSKIDVGLSLKYVYSVMEAFVSNGLAIDMGAVYTDTAKLISVAAALTNLGHQTIYYDNHKEPFPVDLSIAFTKKFAHMPLRFSILAHSLLIKDLSYEKQADLTGEIDEETGEVAEKNISTGDKIMRHFQFSGEFIMSKNFTAMFGYDHQRRREMSPSYRKKFTGYSWGLSFRLKKFRLSYGSRSYFPGNATNQFTLQTNLSTFKRRKRKNAKKS